MAPSSTRLDICLCTVGRPSALEALLDALASQVSTDDLDVSVEVVVVVNGSRAARESPAARRRDGLATRWAVEPRRGIPFARNTSLEKARPSAEFIVFIDDDELPGPGWLDALLRCQQTYNADVVAGPVLPRFISQPPTWALKGGFFDRPRHPTGTRIPIAYTHNTLVRADVLRSLGPRPFNEDMALTGGSDAELFGRLAERGARMFWADDAVVEEWVPPERVRIPWVLRRNFRYGVNHGYLDRRAREAGGGSVAVRILKGIGHILVGIMQMPIRVFYGLPGVVKGLRRVAFGVGNLAGAVGYRYEEYKNIHPWPADLPIQRP